MGRPQFPDTLCMLTKLILLSLIQMISFILLYFVVWFLRLIGYLLEIVVWFYNYLIDCILYLLTQILVWEWTYFGSPISNIPLLVVNFVMEFTQSIFNFLTYPPVILNLMKDKSKESECPLCRVRIKLFERVYM